MAGQQAIVFPTFNGKNATLYKFREYLRKFCLKFRDNLRKFCLVFKRAEYVEQLERFIFSKCDYTLEV